MLWIPKAQQWWLIIIFFFYVCVCDLVIQGRIQMDWGNRGKKLTKAKMVIGSGRVTTHGAKSAGRRIKCPGNEWR